MNEQEVWDCFYAAVKAAGGQRRFAYQNGLTPGYVNDIFHKRRNLSDRVLEIIGIERIRTTYYQEKQS